MLFRSARQTAGARDDEQRGQVADEHGEHMLQAQRDRLAKGIRRNAQTPDRNGKIFYTSTTSLSHISKVAGHEAAHGWRRHCPAGYEPDPASGKPVLIFAKE